MIPEQTTPQIQLRYRILTHVTYKQEDTFSIRPTLVILNSYTYYQTHLYLHQPTAQYLFITYIYCINTCNI
jgi:hypothetical protein